MALTATLRKSPAVDELPHLAAGHALWSAHDYRQQPENGILPQRWEGLPGWLSGKKLPPREHSGWTQPNVWSLGHAYFHESGNNLEQLLLAGRAMNVVWSIATGVLIFCWTRRLFGAGGAWLALGLFAFCPTFLAHGALATSDMCMTFFMLASVGAYWRHLHDFRPATVALSATLLGLAFVAKYSAVLLPPMLAALALLRVLERRPFAWRGQPLVTRASRGAALLLSAGVHAVAIWATIWIFHGFQAQPAIEAGLIHDYTRPWGTVLASVGAPLGPTLDVLRRWHFLPDAYLYGFGFVVDLSQARGAFLNGETSLTGWVRFFPYAFLVKTPLALLLALVAAASAAYVRWRRERGTWADDLRRVAPLLVLSLVYWAVSLGSHLNIGHRHLLPIYPPLFVATGAIGWAAKNFGRPWAWVAGALLAGQVFASVSIRPHYLAFFNPLGGGPAAGYRQLVDSSLDWGQDLPALAEWLESDAKRAAPPRVYLAYFGTGDPAHYGIRAIPMITLLRTSGLRAWYRMQEGTYCVSATTLSHAYSPVRGAWSLAQEQEFQKLRTGEAALLDYAQFPERRPELEREISAEQWQRTWDHYEVLRFARLCHYLRARKPDAQAAYSINIYRLSAAEVQAAVYGDLASWRGAIEQALASRESQ